MIRRSVPGYAAVIEMTGVLARHYARPGSRIYDLGCALGESTLAMLPHLHGRSCTLCLVDHSPAMLARCRERLANMDTDGHFNLELALADITCHPVHSASFVVLNYTLQFIALGRRDALLQRIFSGMCRGGVIWLTEKCRAESEVLEQRLHTAHMRFKQKQGYSPQEVEGKRRALKQVLVPETRHAHLQRLQRIGFASVLPCLHHLQFTSFLAIKT